MNQIQQTKQLPYGVVVGTMHSLMQKSIAQTPDATPMTLKSGTRIKEHVHGNSMYFAKNVKSLTLNGETYDLPDEYSWAFIPEGVSHGWAETMKSGTGSIHSYHPDHDDFVLVPS